jgi:hypothetical protein
VQILGQKPLTTSDKAASKVRRLSAEISRVMHTRLAGNASRNFNAYKCSVALQTHDCAYNNCRPREDDFLDASLAALLGRGPHCSDGVLYILNALATRRMMLLACVARVKERQCEQRKISQQLQQLGSD